MPYESYYNKDERIIYLRYFGDLTPEEFHDSFNDEKDFFEGMTGLVGMRVDLRDISRVPARVLTIGSKTYFARYRPLLIVIVGGHLFARTIAQTFARMTGHNMVFFDDPETADHFLREKLAQTQE